MACQREETAAPPHDLRGVLVCNGVGAAAGYLTDQTGVCFSTATVGRFRSILPALTSLSAFGAARRAGLRARIRSFTFDVVARRRIPALLVTHDEGDVPGEVFHL